MNCVLEYFNSDVIHSNRPAIIFYNGRKSLTDPKRICSFKKLTKLTRIAQNYLTQRGIKRGDKVLLFEKPTPELYAMIVGALGMGVKLMIIEPWMPGAHFDFLLKKHRPKALFSGMLGRGFFT